MAELKLSRAAKADLVQIGAYTIQTWNAEQAKRYLGEIEHCARTLSEKPLLGRSCDEIRPGLRRFEKGRHVLFYRQVTGGILISRILHHSMLPDEDRFGGAQPEV